MSAPTGEKAPTPTAAWPTDTFFTDEHEVVFNGEAIQLRHIPSAHTDGDSTVFFRKSDVIATGDIFITTGYPVVDAKRGGSVSGIIAGLNHIIDVTVPRDWQEGGTVVVPGHGRLADEADVVEYRDMVTIIRERVEALVKKGHDARAGQGGAGPAWTTMGATGPRPGRGRPTCSSRRSTATSAASRDSGSSCTRDSDSSPYSSSGAPGRGGADAGRRRALQDGVRELPRREGQTQAPTPTVLRQLTPEAVLNAMTLGRMQIQSIGLIEAEQRAVAEFVTGRPLPPPAPLVVRNRCTSSAPMRDPSSPGGWNGWGNGVANTRFQSAANGGLTAADLPKLKLKWAYGFPIVTSARSQPMVAGGRLFVASENSEVHALDPKTGCTHWTFKAQAGVRTALVAGAYRTAAGANGFAVFFGDAPRQRVRRGRQHRAADLGAQGGRAPLGGDHRRADLSQRPRLRSGAGTERRGPGRARAVRLLHVPRQRVRARREHRQRGVEDLHHGGAEAARQEQGRAADVGSGRRRHLVVADRGCEAQHALRRHRQQLRGPVHEDDRRGGRPRSRVPAR